jgi:hypothetical protein
MLGSVIPASQPASNQNRSRFRDNHRSSYDTPVECFQAFNDCCGCRRQAQDIAEAVVTLKLKGKPGATSAKPRSLSPFHITSKFICGRLTKFLNLTIVFSYLGLNSSRGFTVQSLPSTLALAISSFPLPFAFLNNNNDRT